MNPSPLVRPQQASDRNRSRIVLTLGQRGPLSRAELARLSGVTRTTIGSYVDRLIDEGVLEELDEVSPASGPGRPSRPVWFHPDAAGCVAILFDEGRIDAALINARGEMRAHAESTVPPGATTDDVTQQVLDLASRIGGADPERLGYGIAVTGMVDAGGTLLSRLARFPGLDGAALVTGLRRAAGVPIVIDNDSRAAALAELWWGHGRRDPAFWAVQIGEGIGGGEIIDGELARGSVGTAGEIGHMVVDRRGRDCACGLRGCWETLASAHALIDEATRRGIPLTDAPDAPADAPTSSVVGQLTARIDTDPLVDALIEEWSADVALGLANITRLRDPALIVLQGPVTAGGPVLRDRIRAHLRARSLLHDGHVPRIEFSDLGEHARLFGAAALVLAHTWSLD